MIRGLDPAKEKFEINRFLICLGRSPGKYGRDLALLGQSFYNADFADGKALDIQLRYVRLDIFLSRIASISSSSINTRCFPGPRVYLFFTP